MNARKASTARRDRADISARARESRSTGWWRYRCSRPGVSRFDLLRVHAEGRRLFAVDLDVDLRPCDLQVARDVEQLRQGLELLLDDRHPVVQLFRARALNYVLVLALGQLAADSDSRDVLDENLDSHHVGELRAQAPHDFIRRLALG